MSAVERFHEAANDALVALSERCLPGAELALVIYTEGEPGRDIVIADRGLDRDQVISTLRRRGLSIDGDNAYKQDLLDAVVGAMAMGAQNTNPPPADHWGQRLWDIARAERARTEELVEVLKGVQARCKSAGYVGVDGQYLKVVSAAIAKATQ